LKDPQGHFPKEALGKAFECATMLDHLFWNCAKGLCQNCEGFEKYWKCIFDKIFVKLVSSIQDNLMCSKIPARSAGITSQGVFLRWGIRGNSSPRRSEITPPPPRLNEILLSRMDSRAGYLHPG
jgi:hypothetical protein